MDPIQKWRKSNPPAPGSIPYGPLSYQDDRGCVYSLDKFRPRFPLNWQNLVITIDGKPLPPSDQNVLAAVRSFLRGFDPKIEARAVDHGPGRFGGNLYWWRYAGGIITLHKFKPFGSEDYNYSLLCEFNPNKSDLEPWRDLIAALCTGFGDRFCWSNTRLDYALDIPFPISDVRLLTRKVGSCYQGTYYFGTRGSSGYTRVYDKRKEIIDKQKQDIGREVTRIEWESRAGDPLHMDFPFLIQNLGRYEVLRFVPMNDWPAALRTFDERTAAKIKRESLRCVDVDPALFDALAADLFEYFGLTAEDNVDHLVRRQMDAAGAEDLERIQSQLRKWAGVDH